MFTFLGAHPNTFAFWSDLVVILALFVSIVVIVIIAYQPGADPQKLIAGTVPLSIVFAALVIGLSMQCCTHLKN